MESRMATDRIFLFSKFESHMTTITETIHIDKEKQSMSLRNRRSVWNRWRRKQHDDEEATTQEDTTSHCGSTSPPSAELFVITKTDSKSQSREKLKKSFARNNVVMRVIEKDIIPGDEEADADDTDLYKGQLILPRSETEYGSSKVPNCCVICLDSYLPGDLVVWSSNPMCSHAFHRYCMMKYLVRIQKRSANTPCCVCRCHFTDVEVEPREQHVHRVGRNGRRAVRTNQDWSTVLPEWWVQRRRNAAGNS